METEAGTGTEAREAVMPEPEIFITVMEMRWSICSVPGSYSSCTVWDCAAGGAEIQSSEGQGAARERGEGQRDYVEKKLNCLRKEISVYLISQKHHFKRRDWMALPGRWNSRTDGLQVCRVERDALQDAQVSGCALWSADHGALRGGGEAGGFVCYTRSNHHVEEIVIRQGL